MKKILSVLLFICIHHWGFSQEITSPYLKKMAETIATSLISDDMDAIRQYFVTPELFMENKMKDMDENKRVFIYQSADRKQMYRRAAENYIYTKMMDDFFDAHFLAFEKKEDWKYFNLDKVMIFDENNYDDGKKRYQVYYFLHQKMTNQKYIAEGDIVIINEKYLNLFDIDALHKASDLEEYIKVRREVDAIESHPKSVKNYLKQKR